MLRLFCPIFVFISKLSGMSLRGANVFVISAVIVILVIVLLCWCMLLF